MSRIVIQMEGGLVQDVFISGIGKPTTAVIVDFDTEGADDQELTSIDDTGGWKRIDACIHTEKLHTLPRKSDVARLVKAYDKKQED